MFWKFNLLTSHIDTLLEKEDVTLYEILDEDDVLQECKAQNKRLIEFLVKPENIEELVNLVTQEPSDDKDEKERYKYPNTACELLTSDVSAIVEKLAGEEALLNKIYGFLENEGPLNPLMASFFSKVMGLLIARKSELMLKFLESKEDFVGQLLHHLGTSAIMDLLLRLISCIDNPECHQQCLAWLCNKNLISKLVGMIDPSQTDDKHCNAAQSLCDIIRLSREQMSQLQEKADPDPLLMCLESQETVVELLNHMFNGEQQESVLVSGLSVIQTLLEYRRLSPDGGPEQMTSLDADRLAQGVNNALQALTPRLKDFHEILSHPPKQHYLPMPTSIGTADPPLGNTRLQIARLLAALLLSNKLGVNEEFASLKTISVLIELFFKYMWNNFLHFQVELCIGTILDSCPMEEEEKKCDNLLLNQLFLDLKILEKILEAWEENDKQMSRPGGRRHGYMGHLTRIANNIIDASEKGRNSDRIKELCKELPQDFQEKWDKFVQGSLAEINKQNTVELVSMVGSHGINSSSEDDDPEFREIAFPPDTMQQARRKARLTYSEYQLQPMTSNFIDQLGFNEDDFAEQEERVDLQFSEKISSINFDINTDSETHSATLFEQACRERMNQFDDNDIEEDLWEEKEITFSQNSSNKPSSSSPQGSGRGNEPQAGSSEEDGDSGDSSDSEEDLTSPKVIQQSPDSSPTTPTSTSTTPTDTPTSTPAGTPTASENMDVDNGEGWANFDDINMDTGPTAPDTTTALPWNGASQSHRDESPSGAEQGKNWAKFQESPQAPDQSRDAKVENNWADFSGFSDISQSSDLNMSDPGPRVNSPVAMDTNESSVGSSRTSAYLMSSAPADLATEVSESGSGDVSSTADSPASQPQIPHSTKSDERTSADSTTASVSSEKYAPAVDSSSPSPMDSATSSCVSSDRVLNPHPADEPHPSSPGPVASSNADDPAVSENNAENNLSDNFNSPTSAGLMTCSVATEAAADSTQKNKLEEIRAQAKEALREFTEATQNGPV